MVFKEHLAVLAQQGADQGNALFGGVHNFRAQVPRGIQVVDIRAGFALLEEIDLNRSISLVDGRLAGVLVFFQGAAAVIGLSPPAKLQLACVGPKPVPLLPAQQLVHRRAVVFALDIPKRGVNRADSGHDDGAVPLCPEGVLVQLFPDNLVVEGVHAKDYPRVILQQLIGCRRAGDNGNAGLANAIDSLVGIDTADNWPDRTGAFGFQLHNINAYDFHSLSTPPVLCNTYYIIQDSMAKRKSQPGAQRKKARSFVRFTQQLYFLGGITIVFFQGF